MDQAHSELCFALSIFISVFLICPLSGQSNDERQTALAYDLLVGIENNSLYSGPEFKDQYRDSWDGSHIYLDSSTFMNSTLIYDGQLYTNVLLQYDVLDDNIIIRSDGRLSTFKITIDKRRLASFSVNGRQFIKLKDYSDEQINSFYQIGKRGDSLSLYIKHQKRRKLETIDNIPQYKIESKNYYLLEDKKGEHFLIYSTKDFKDIFPSRYKRVRNFYKQNRSLSKKDPDTFMINLVTHLEELNRDK